MLLKLINDSFLVNKADYIIFVFVTLLLLSLIFASTSQIGLLAGLCFLFFALKFLFKSDKKFFLTGFNKPIFYYIAITGLSVVFSPLFLPSLGGYLKILTYFGLYLTFFSVLKGSKKRTYYIFAIITFAAFVESIAAINQNISGVEALATWQDETGLNPEQIMNRVYGTLQPCNPNLLAGYLIASISSAVGLFFIFAVKKNYTHCVLAFITAATILSATVFTGSRGSYVALAVILIGVVMAAGHIIWHDYGDNKKLKHIWIAVMLAGIIVAAAVFLSSPALQSRVASVFEFRGDSSNAFRLNVYVSSAKMFLDNWIMGVGPGNETFRLMYGLYMRTGFDALGAYSVPLEIAVESGVFALLAFLWIIFNIFIGGLKVVLGNNKIEQKIIILVCILGVAGIMAHGLVDTIFFRPQVQILFWMLVAVAGVNLQKTQNNV